MLKNLPGVFAAGEMLDWEAPTGGYLLTACLATGRAVAGGINEWLRLSANHAQVQFERFVWRIGIWSINSNKVAAGTTSSEWNLTTPSLPTSLKAKKPSVTSKSERMA